MFTSRPDLVKDRNPASASNLGDGNGAMQSNALASASAARRLNRVERPAGSLLLQNRACRRFVGNQAVEEAPLQRRPDRRNLGTADRRPDGQSLGRYPRRNAGETEVGPTFYDVALLV